MDADEFRKRSIEEQVSWVILDVKMLPIFVDLYDPRTHPPTPEVDNAIRDSDFLRVVLLGASKRFPLHFSLAMRLFSRLDNFEGDVADMDGIVTLLQVVEANADNEDLVESALLAIASFATDEFIRESFASSSLPKLISATISRHQKSERMIKAVAIALTNVSYQNDEFKKALVDIGVPQALMMTIQIGLDDRPSSDKILVLCSQALRNLLHFSNKYSEALDSVENDILSSFATIIAKIKSTSNFDAMTHLLWAVFNVIFERNGRMKKFFESGGHMAVADLLKGLNNHEILENYAVYQIVFNLVTQLSTSGTMRLKLGKVNIVSGVLHALDIIPQEEIKSLRNGLRALTHLLKQAVNRKRFVSSEHMLTFVMYFLDKISRDRDTVLLFLEICRRLVKGAASTRESLLQANLSEPLHQCAAIFSDDPSIKAKVEQLIANLYRPCNIMEENSDGEDPEASSSSSYEDFDGFSERKVRRQLYPSSLTSSPSEFDKLSRLLAGNGSPITAAKPKKLADGDPIEVLKASVREGKFIKKIRDLEEALREDKAQIQSLKEQLHFFQVANDNLHARNMELRRELSKLEQRDESYKILSTQHNELLVELAESRKTIENLLAHESALHDVHKNTYGVVPEFTPQHLGHKSIGSNS